MKKHILYLHGFCSSPESFKARAVAKALQQKGKADCFSCPFLSHVPEKAIAQAEKIIVQLGQQVTLVGSSLGGFYATWLAEKYKLNAVLINPAVVARLSLAQFLGEQTNLYTQESFELTLEHITQLRQLEVAEITPERYFLMVETGDELLDYRQAVERYQGCRQVVIEGGDHSFSHFPDMIPQLIEFAGL